MLAAVSQLLGALRSGLRPPRPVTTCGRQCRFVGCWLLPDTVNIDTCRHINCLYGVLQVTLAHTSTTIAAAGCCCREDITCAQADLTGEYGMKHAYNMDVHWSKVSRKGREAQRLQQAVMPAYGCCSGPAISACCGCGCTCPEQMV